MASPGNVTIRIYNEAGDLADEIDDSKPAGLQTSQVSTGRMAPGVYYYLLSIRYDSGGSENQGVQKFVVIH